ncbi:unnamed protein product [Bursaphelenchus xylophilus]|uniref:(pine wood nematode) hypothetical protein n=1 Tax=Bursaphelenchus xylophilus TaxID=6326 RepID=A0A1I7RML8_BURXY|nr:unnamed protein product [Bursaphelenchus xylophilus]CAG9125688.1 unnamed protein product [Bursaphelenchus xylophilus]
MSDFQAACTSTAVCSQPRFGCKVCSGPTKFYHFGMQLCRGCASFFQRCVKGGKKYECKNDNYQCNVGNEVIVKCKGCRFAKCVHVWSKLNIQTNATTPKTYNFALYENGMTSVAYQLVKAFENYHDFQLNTVQKHLSINNLTTDKYLLPTKMDLFCMGYASRNAMYKIFTDCISCMKFPNKAVWTQFTNSSQYESMIIQQGFLTSMIFPDMDDTRIIFIPGYFFHVFETTEDWWFEDEADEKERSKYREYIYQFNRRYMQFMRNYKQTRPSALDVGVLMLLIFLRHYENLGPVTKEYDAYKDRVLTEWAQSLQTRYAERANEKLIEFMLICNEAAKLKTVVEEIDAYINLMRAHGAKLTKWTNSMPVDYYEQ